MDAILLCMKKKGIRFFKNIKFPNTDVVRFHKKDNFLGLLHSRTRLFDNVLLMAHGSNKGILTTTHDLNHQYTLYIDLSEAKSFKNDFVFAISCSTANEFGEKCVEEGAIAYLGYQVEIGCLFFSYSKENSSIPKRINTAVDIIIKRIFVQELSKAYEKFLTEPISVQLLKEKFSYSLEKRVSSILDKSVDQIYTEFGVKISDRDYKKYVASIVLNVLSYLDEVTERLICIGDSNYISSSYLEFRKLKGIGPEQLLIELERNPFFINLEHEPYKAYLRDVAGKVRGDEINA